jgi:type IV secretion system protein VirD4
MSVENTLVGPELQNRSAWWKTPVALRCALDVLLGCVIATEVAAYLYQFDPVLGPSFYGVYPPWAVFVWFWNWHDFEPDVFRLAACAGGLVTFFLLLVLALNRLARVGQFKANRYLHGSARWANEVDLQRAGLLGDKGVCVGAWMKGKRLQTLRHHGPENVLVLAPPRSGKGVSLIVPTLLGWEQSVVVTDPRGELKALTSGFRKQAGNKVLFFEPAATASCAWNPLQEIRRGGPHEIADVQNLAALLADPDGKGLDSGIDAHWKLTSHALLVGCILHLLNESKGRGQAATLPGLARMLSDPELPAEQLWRAMINARSLGGHAREVAAEAAEEQRTRPEKEAGSVLSFARSRLSLFRDPIVAENVSRSDFQVADLMRHDDPVSLYIITQPVDQSRLRPLVRILVNMIVRVLASKLEFEHGQPKPTYKHRLLLLLDEFPMLGKLEVVQESLAFLGGYGVKFMLIAQDLAQIRGAYGTEESITSNCHVQCAFAPNRVETAEHLSKLAGTTTIVKEQVTVSGRGESDRISKTMQAVQRPLLTADECMRLPGARKDPGGMILEPGDMLISVAGFPVCYGKQPLYFKNPVLAERAAIEAPPQSDVLAP